MRRFIIIFVGLVLFSSISGILLYKYLNDSVPSTPLTFSPTVTSTIQPTPFPTLERVTLYGETIPDRAEISILGDAKVRIVDDKGNVTCLTDFGFIVEEIPYSSCLISQGGIFITLPAETKATLYITMGKGFGPQIEVSRLVHSTGGIFLPEQRAIFLDFPLTAGGTAEMSINVLQDLSNLKLLINRHHEGKSSLMVTPSSVIDYKQAEDITNPVTTITVVGRRDVSGFYTGSVTVTLSAEDDYTGVLKTNYSLDGGKNWQTYTDPLNINAEQVPIIYAESIDKAGNREYPWSIKRLRP